MSKKKICVLGGGAWGKNHIKTLDKLGALGAIVEKMEIY
jgi:UDP-2-acetamido-3-amino-2,3-dideoxy-glucuronate N-acetyltransferase